MRRGIYLLFYTRCSIFIMKTIRDTLSPWILGNVEIRFQLSNFQQEVKRHDNESY